MTNKNMKACKESKFTRCVKAPFRILGKVMDLYVKGITQCSGRPRYGGPRRVPVKGLPKSLSITSLKTDIVDEDLRELIRAASTKSLGNKINNVEEIHMPRSFTTSMARIDEDKPCEFGEDLVVVTNVYPKSRSHAVGRRQLVFV